MFTGLISEIGKITAISRNQEGAVFTLFAKKTSSQIALGDSIAINGTCLTAIAFNHDHFSVQAVHITLQKTNLGSLLVGSTVNLELALKASDRLGGHLVQGHINGIGRICNIISLGNNFELSIQVPAHLQHYMINEGSIALDGISLTIARVTKDGISVSIIPHTWHATILHMKKIGDSINVEVDVIAKYVEQFARIHSAKSLINKDWLQMQGY